MTWFLKGLKNIKDLKRGDIVRHKLTGVSYTVDMIFDNYAIGVRIIHISNPMEWVIIKRSDKIKI